NSRTSALGWQARCAAMSGSSTSLTCGVCQGALNRANRARTRRPVGAPASPKPTPPPLLLPLPPVPAVEPAPLAPAPGVPLAAGPVDESAPDDAAPARPVDPSVVALVTAAGVDNAVAVVALAAPSGVSAGVPT